MIRFTFEGRPVSARPGQSLAAALIASGIRALRETGHGDCRGVFCGIGVCQECLVEIDGRQGIRACMTPVRPGIAVRRQPARPALAALPPRPRLPARHDSPDVLVLGGGVAGLSAAIAAAEAGARVMLLDERHVPGGQFYKQPAGGAAPLDAQQRAGAALLDAARAAGVEMLAAVTLWGAFDGPLFLAEREDEAGDQALALTPRAVVVATGAHERVRMVPGWQLPGVMTTGAAQTLWRSYRTLPGARVVVAGSGPLNMQVALELARGGAAIVLLAEAAPRPVARPGAALAMAAADPGLALTGLGFLVGLARRGVPVAHLSAITAIEPAPGGAGAGLLVHARGPGGAFRVEADAVCLNDGFQPQNEVLRLLGVRMHYDARFDQLRPERDATMQTSLPGIFAAGDCCGLGGARAAREEGLIAGAAAAAHAAGRPIPALPAARRRLARARRFQAALWRLFEPGPGPLDSLAPEVPVCRCENVTRAQIDAALAADIAEIGALKRATRAGMGRCQGRFCQPVLARLVTARAGRLPGPFDFFAPRVPIRPVAIEALLAAGSAGAVPAAPWSGGPPDAQAGMPSAPDAGDG